MKNINFIRGRERKYKVQLLGVDLGFMVIVAFITMFSLSVIMSWGSGDQLKVKSYVQTKITKLKKVSAEYNEIKTQRDKLLDLISALANIKESQHFVLLGVEKISRAITSGLYLTNMEYVAKDNYAAISGKVKNLKLLSVFMGNLEKELLAVKKVDLKSLSSEKNGEREFVLKFKYFKENALKGDDVK